MSAIIDLARCARARTILVVKGSPHGEVRAKAIEDAITAFQLEGAQALREGFIGVKNYAHFGDQRSDHRYGYGPAHGVLVFTITRHDTGEECATSDAVYFLEAVRDFGTVMRPRPDRPSLVEPWNLCDVLDRLQKIDHERAELCQVLAAVEIESSEVPSA
jgi:hypothetical protein